MKSSKAFTLVELLSVILIIAILAGIVVMSMAGKVNAPGFTSSIKEVASIIEFARSEAMTKKKDIFVVFADGDESLDPLEQQYRLYSVFRLVDENNPKTPKNVKDDTPEVITRWEKLHASINFSSKNINGSENSENILNVENNTYTFEVDGENNISGKFPYIKFNKYGMAQVEDNSGDNQFGEESKNFDSFEIHFVKSTEISKNTDQELPYIKIYKNNGRVEVIDY